MKSISFLGFRPERNRYGAATGRRAPPDVTLRATVSEAITDVCYRGTLAIVYDPDPDLDSAIARVRTEGFLRGRARARSLLAEERPARPRERGIRKTV